MATQPGGGDAGEGGRYRRASYLPRDDGIRCSKQNPPFPCAIHSQLIRELISDFPYLAMDTEFPGVVAKPVGNFKKSREFHYQMLRCVAP